MRAESGAAERRHYLETLLLKHGGGAVGGFISEGARFPASNGVGFHKAASLSLYGVESGLQRCGGRAASAIFLQHGEAGDSPELHGGCRLEPTILAETVDPRKLFPTAVPAPSHRPSVRIHEDSMRASSVHQVSLLPAVPHGSFCPGAQPLRFSQAARTVEMHATRMVPSIPL